MDRRLFLKRIGIGALAAFTIPTVLITDNRLPKKRLDKTLDNISNMKPNRTPLDTIIEAIDCSHFKKARTEWGNLYYIPHPAFECNT